LVIADKILNDSPYKTMRADRYASFDSGKGAEFAAGKMTLEDLAATGVELGEPAQLSGKQELYEALINQYV
jgi:xylose isomerase